MPYRRIDHDTLNYARRLVAELTPDNNGDYYAGVPASFLAYPRQYIWNDTKVGCLPLRVGGARLLVRMEVLLNRAVVTFSAVEKSPSGGALFSRAELIFRELFDVHPDRKPRLTRLVNAHEHISSSYHLFRFSYNLLDYGE